MDRVMDARRKTKINRLQREVLVRMFRSGMRGCGKETLLLRQKAAGETGLSMTSINHWINNWKKRHAGDHEEEHNENHEGEHEEEHEEANEEEHEKEQEESDLPHTLAKRHQHRKASAYNPFSKRFHQQDQSLKGKSLSEKSTLMAEALDKEKFQSEDVDSDTECSFTPNQKRKLFFRVARRHQGDANTLESMGYQMLTLMYMKGQTVAVGTAKGKQFLHSHPAVLAAFNSHFLYDDFAAQYATTSSHNCSTNISISPSSSATSTSSSNSVIYTTPSSSVTSTST